MNVDRLAARRQKKVVRQKLHIVSLCNCIFVVLLIGSNVMCLNYFVHVLFEFLYLCLFDTASQLRRNFPYGINKLLFFVAFCME